VVVSLNSIQPLIADDGPKLGDMLPRLADRFRYWVFGLVFVMMLASFNGQLRLSPDSARYLLTGHRLAQGGSWGDPAGYSAELSPGFPRLVALVDRAFGSQANLALHLLLLAAGLAGVALVYRLFIHLVGRPTAVILTLMVGVSHGVFPRTFQAMPDIFFYDGLLLVLLAWARITKPLQPIIPGASQWHRWGRMHNSLAMFIAGFALMAVMRSVVVVPLAAVVLACVWGLVVQRKWRLIAVAALAAALLLAVVHALQPGPVFALTRDEAHLKRLLIDQLPQTVSLAFTETGPALLREHLPEGLSGINAAFIAWPVGIFAAVGGFLVIRREKLLGLVFVLFFAQWLITGSTSRYLAVAVPCLALGWWWLAAYFEKRIGSWPGTAVLITMLAVAPLGSILSSGSMMLTQRAKPFEETYRQGAYARYRALADEMHSKLPDDALIIAGDHASAELALLSGMDVRQRVSHVYDFAIVHGETAPIYVVTPLTPNAQAHVDRADLLLGPVLFSITDVHGIGLEIRPARVQRRPDKD